MKKITKEEVTKEEVVEIAEDEFLALCSDIMSDFMSECVEHNASIGETLRDLACVAAFASCLAEAIFDDENYDNPENDEESEEK